jgi:hypothetical protein
MNRKKVKVKLQSAVPLNKKKNENLMIFGFLSTLQKKNA